MIHNVEVLEFEINELDVVTILKNIGQNYFTQLLR